MLERGIEARFAKSVFYEHVNDIDVYIEDRSDITKKMLSIIVGRVLGGKIQLSTVFPLGDRYSVIDACAADQEAGGRPRVFIVDGDFSLWSCYSYIRLKRLFVLPRYCVENYLLDAQAFLTVLYEEDPAKDVDQLEGDFDFNGWVEENLNRLARLFAAYSVTHRLAPSTPTVGRPVRQFVADNRGTIDAAKVEHAIDGMRNVVDGTHSVGTFDEALEGVVEQFGGESEEYIMNFISGKDYLLPLLMMRFRATVRSQTTNSSIQIRLAQRSDVSDLDSLRVMVSGEM